MSPTCCEASKTNRTVILFVPRDPRREASWNVPIRVEDDDAVAKNVSTQARFCPFCGVALGREHLPFEPTRGKGNGT